MHACDNRNLLPLSASTKGMFFVERNLRMRALVFCLFGTLFVLGANAGWGQVVQTPTFQNTGVSTTVDVPAGGSAYLGGLGRAGATSVQRRATLFGNRGGGIYSSGSGNGVIATVIDMRALDEAILNQKIEPGLAIKAGRSALPLSGRKHPGTNYRKISTIPGSYMQALAGDPALNFADHLNADTSADIRELAERARAARQAGRYAAAEVYYRMIIDRLPSEVLSKLEAEIRLNQKRKSAPPPQKQTPSPR
jgi:hypothetical protein